jgi:hemolysin D
LFAAALTWSFVGQVDIVAVAPGRIVVSERTKQIQPLETSVVRAIHVRDGSRVRAGELLVELDATLPGADAQAVQDQRATAQGEVARATALLAATRTGAAPRLADTRDLAADTGPQLQAEWADIAARLTRLDAEAARREAELATHRQQLAKLQAMLPLAQQREADIQALSAQGFVAGHAGQDRTRERIELERDTATQQARIAEAQAALAEARQARAAALADVQRGLSDRLAKARLTLAQLAQETRKTDHRQALTRLLAPVDGTVQQVAVHTTGGVVTAAQPLMVIVPDNAEVTAQVVLDNKDIGFIRPGQTAAVKLDTFNFTRYGTVAAVVRQVSADAVMDDKLGATFPATLDLLARDIQVDGRRVALAPGMTLAAEVNIGRRRVIDYLLSPVQQRVGESMGER